MGGNSSCPADVLDPVWVSDSEGKRCMHCACAFTVTRRRHHCRSCGGLFCQACSKNKRRLEDTYGFTEPQRVCTVCAMFFDGGMALPASAHGNGNGSDGSSSRGSALGGAGGSPGRGYTQTTATVVHKMEPRSRVTDATAMPPLAKAYVAAKSFTLNIASIQNWRPINHRTALYFTPISLSRRAQRERDAMRSGARSPRSRSPMQSGLEPSPQSGLVRRVSAMSGASGAGGRRGGGSDGGWELSVEKWENVALVQHAEGVYVTITTATEEHRLQVVSVKSVDKSSVDATSSGVASTAPSLPSPIPVAARPVAAMPGGAMSFRGNTPQGLFGPSSAVAPGTGGLRALSSSARQPAMGVSTRTSMPEGATPLTSPPPPAGGPQFGTGAGAVVVEDPPTGEALTDDAIERSTVASTARQASKIVEEEELTRKLFVTLQALHRVAERRLKHVPDQLKMQQAQLEEWDDDMSDADSVGSYGG